MVRQFYIMLSLMALLLSVVVVDYLSYDRGDFRESIESISALTTISSPSMSSSWYEPRLLYMDDRENPIYPEMCRVDKMGFVYAK